MSESELETTFVAFWQAYPKKRAKKDAKKAWFDATLTPAIIELIMSALSWQTLQVSWIKDDGEFIPYPATWIRGERWEDQQHVTQPALLHLAVPAPLKTQQAQAALAAVLNRTPGGFH